MTRVEALRIGPQRKRLRAQWRTRVALHLFREGFSRREVAELLGIEPSTLRRYHGAPRMEPGYAVAASASATVRLKAGDWRRRVARRLVNDGMEIEEIAKMFSVQPETVDMYFKRGGRVRAGN